MLRKYLLHWFKRNHLLIRSQHLRIGYSKKGWTNGEIGVEWIKDFDKNTKDKANGRYRLLLVDGHNSHYTRAFLMYARLHQIIVLCYPSHTTHLLQGLDVVIFAILKHWLSYERDQWERETGESVSKSNFLQIYGRAHFRALTPENIKTAFRKTGIWPLDRNVISKADMAPSKETSCEAHLPIESSLDVQAVVGLLKKMSLADEASAASSGATGGVENNVGSGIEELRVEGDGVVEQAHDAEAVRETINQIMNGDMAYLLSSDLVTSESAIPPMLAAPIPAAPRRFSGYTPTTPSEIALFAALREAEAREQLLQKRCAELQASNILNELYCGKLRGQLAHKDETKAKGKGKGKLMGDGLPCMLTGDEFYEKVVVHETGQKRAAKDKANRAQVRESLAEAMAKWKREDKERKERNVVRCEVYKAAVEQWVVDKAAGKSSTKEKPGREKLEKPVPRPKATDIVEEIDSEQEEGGGSGDDDDDEDE